MCDELYIYTYKHYIICGSAREYYDTFNFK